MVENSRKGIEDNNVKGELASRAKSPLASRRDPQDRFDDLIVNSPRNGFIVGVGQEYRTKVWGSPDWFNFVAGFLALRCKCNILAVEVRQAVVQIGGTYLGELLEQLKSRQLPQKPLRQIPCTLCKLYTAIRRVPE